MHSRNSNSTALPEISVITDHGPLVAILKKDVATLLERLQIWSRPIHSRLVVMTRS